MSFLLSASSFLRLGLHIDYPLKTNANKPQTKEKNANPNYGAYVYYSRNKKTNNQKNNKPFASCPVAIVIPNDDTVGSTVIVIIRYMWAMYLMHMMTMVVVVHYRDLHGRSYGTGQPVDCAKWNKCGSRRGGEAFAPGFEPIIAIVNSVIAFPY